MTVFTIAKTKQRASDLSGTGAFCAGGRWNNQGNFALYTSESQSLAMLEVLVHVDESELPSDLYIVTIEIGDNDLIYQVTDAELPVDWRAPENIVVKNMGDQLLKNNKHLGFTVRSAVMQEEYNRVLNPAHEDFAKYVKVVKVEKLTVAERLKR